MAIPLKVLIAEDDPNDAELLLLQLERAGFAAEYLLVSTEVDYARALDEPWEIVLSDFQMGKFTGLRALELLKERELDIPFVIVSGTIGEETAAEVMRLGAADYLLKDRLARLGSAITRALEDGRLRRERMQVVEELRLFRLLVGESNDTFEVIDPISGAFLDVNAKGPNELGYTKEEYLALRVFDIDPNLTINSWPDLAEKIRKDGAICHEGNHRRKDGSFLPVEVNSKWVRFERDYIVSVVRDIRERKQAEISLRASELRFRTTLENLMEGCQILSRDWRYLYVNEMAARHAQRTVRELMGRRMMEVFPGIETSPMFAALRRSVEDNSAREIENEFPRPDGSSSWFQLVIQPVPEGLFVLSLDITDRKKAEKANQHQLVELRRWHALTLGREDRVRSLKAEVNEILARLGEPPRYAGGAE